MDTPSVELIHSQYGCVQTSMTNTNASGDQALKLMQSGLKLRSVQARVLERKLGKNPLDAESRLKLLGYYFNRYPYDTIRKCEHILWFIENLYDHPLFCSGPSFSIIDREQSRDFFEEAIHVWRNVLRRKQVTSQGWLNYAYWLLLSFEFRKAENAYKKALVLDPTNPYLERVRSRLDRLKKIDDEEKREERIIYAIAAKESVRKKDR